MPFASSDPAALQIREAAGRGTLSHALLFTGGGDLTGAARYAAAAMECLSGRDKPCGVCPACRKVLSGIHPDVVTVRDEAHRFLSAETIRAVRSDAYIRPNEGARKIYLFPDCDLLDPKAQNVLLKVLEDGPPHVTFLFCARNVGKAHFNIRCNAGFGFGKAHHLSAAAHRRTDYKEEYNTNYNKRQYGKRRRNPAAGVRVVILNVYAFLFPCFNRRAVKRIGTK